MDINYQKYIKYRNKYLKLKQYGSSLNKLEQLYIIFQNKQSWLDLSILTCATILSTDDIISYLKEYDTVCSYYGKKISDTLINDTVSHIFNIKEQFITELIKNGFDAQIHNKSGKFSVGFFSALIMVHN